MGVRTHIQNERIEIEPLLAGIIVDHGLIDGVEEKKFGPLLAGVIVDHDIIDKHKQHAAIPEKFYDIGVEHGYATFSGSVGPGPVTYSCKTKETGICEKLAPTYSAKVNDD